MMPHAVMSVMPDVLPRMAAARTVLEALATAFKGYTDERAAIQNAVNSAGSYIFKQLQSPDAAINNEILERWPNDAKVKLPAWREMAATHEINSNVPEFLSQFQGRVALDDGVTQSLRNVQNAFYQNAHHIGSWKINRTLCKDYTEQMATGSNKMKSAMLMGERYKNGSAICGGNCYCGLMLLDAGVDYPSHAHSPEEFFFIIQGIAEWSIGNAPWDFKELEGYDEAKERNGRLYMTKRVMRPGEVVHHPSCVPHGVSTMKSTEPLVAAYFWVDTENRVLERHNQSIIDFISNACEENAIVPVPYCFTPRIPVHEDVTDIELSHNDKEPVPPCRQPFENGNKRKFSDINQSATRSAEAAELYYDKMAATYAETVKTWGYEMPQRIVQMLVDVLQLDVENASAFKSTRVLDLACGDGLVAEELRKRCSVHSRLEIVGADISEGMLALAEKKRFKDGPLYNSLKKADLSRSLPTYGLSKNHFDILLCVGATSYFVDQPQVLAEWSLVTRIGGYIGFTSKTAVWESWEPFQRMMTVLPAERKAQNSSAVLQGDAATVHLEEVFRSDDLPYLPGFQPEDSDRERFEKERGRIYLYRRLA